MKEFYSGYNISELKECLKLLQKEPMNITNNKHINYIFNILIHKQLTILRSNKSKI